MRTEKVRGDEHEQSDSERIATMPWLINKIFSGRRKEIIDATGITDALLDYGTDMVAVTDKSGKLVRCSRALAVRVKGADRVEDPSEFPEFLEEKSRHDYQKILEYVRREGKPIVDFRVRVSLPALDRDMILTVVPSAARNGSSSTLLHFLREVHAGTAEAPDLGHIEKLTNVGQIAAGMAHELNTPLGSIILSAEHIRESVDDPEIAEEAVRVKSRAEHCSKVVKELLGFVRRDDQGHGRYILLEIVEKVIDLVSAEAKRSHIELTMHPENGSVPVKCIENQIEQLLFNLISNAFHAIGADGQISISFHRDNMLNRVHMSVQDNGKGIPEKYLETIFDPFFTTKPGGQGTGLGLALCKKIALEHGGDIRVNSSEGQGTTFDIALPIAE